MATRTSITNGSWSATGTWGAAIPADGDSVVIATGTTVTFDADQTAFLTGVGLTVNAGGVLTASTASGSYCLRIGVANPTINGTLTIGTSATPYPFDCKFTIRMTGGGSSSRYFTGAGYKYFCGTEPTTLLVKLKETATIGATAFTVVNLTGGTVNLSADAVPWVIGNTIGICDSATPRNDTETLTISSFSTSGSDCVIQTTAGLASQKDVDSIVYLQTRNVRVTDGTSYFLYGNNNYVCCEVSGQSLVGYNLNNLNVIGGCYHHQSQAAFSSCYNSTFSNAVFGQTAYPYFMVQNTNTRVDNCYFIGTATTLCLGTNMTGVIDNSYFFGHGNPTQYNIDSLKYNNCTFDYNTTAIYYFGASFYNCSFSNISNAIINTPNNSFSLYNCSFGSVELVGLAAQPYAADTVYVDSFDHNQVSGAYKSWTKGAITTYPETIEDLAGQTSAYKVTFSSASYYGYYQCRESILPNETLTYRVYVKKSASMTYLPRIQIIDSSQDPLERSSSFTPLVEQTMTDSIDTWEYYDITYTNTTTMPKNVYLRVLGKNASDYVYVVPIKLEIKESWG